MAIISSVSILPLILLKFSYFALFYFIYIYLYVFFLIGCARNETFVKRGNCLSAKLEKNYSLIKFHEYV